MTRIYVCFWVSYGTGTYGRIRKSTAQWDEGEGFDRTVNAVLRDLGGIVPRQIAGYVLDRILFNDTSISARTHGLNLVTTLPIVAMRQLGIEGKAVGIVGFYLVFRGIDKFDRHERPSWM